MRLAAFDLDGNLIRGQTTCEAIAAGIGHIERMRQFEQLRPNQFEEVTAAVEEMARWYSVFTFSDLKEHLRTVQLAPGAKTGFDLLRDHGFNIAIISLTWEFAVEWLANRLGADHFIGRGLSSEGVISHFWPQDKARWLTELAARLGVDMNDVSAAGDSRGDIPMLISVGHGYWVGQEFPPELDGKVIHEPAGDIYLLATKIIELSRDESRISSRYVPLIDSAAFSVSNEVTDAEFVTFWVGHNHGTAGTGRAEYCPA